MGAVALVTFVAALAAIGARATYGARVTADEPQYLTTAISIAEDFNLDISDELAERRFEPYHEIDLNTQTIDLDGSGQRISPHDPLLPALLALPMRVGGWVAAKTALAALAAATAAVTVWLAVRRFEVPVGVAAPVVGAFFVSPPLTAYATQVYPEMPAALCVAVGLAAVTGPRGGGADRPRIVVGKTTSTARPWPERPVSAANTSGKHNASPRGVHWLSAHALARGGARRGVGECGGPAVAVDQVRSCRGGGGCGSRGEILGS